MQRASVMWTLLASPIGWAMGVPPPPPPPAPAPAPAQPAPVQTLWCENVVEMRTSRRSGVTSVWLANGVRLHHLKLERRPGLAVMTITLSGGKLLEDAGTRGMSEIVANVIDDWDAAAPDASRAEAMAGRNVRIDCGAGPDTITLRLEGSVGDMEPALRVASELMTTPTITRAAVDGAREQVLRELRMRGTDARAAISDAINQAIMPPPPGGDPRLQPPEERVLNAADEKGAKAWWDRHCKAGGAPIECAIAGDITLAEALRMADATLGGLPARGRIGVDTNQALRQVQNPRGAVRNVVSNAGVAPGRAALVRGAFGPEMGALEDQRALRAGVRVAIARLKRDLGASKFALGPSDPGGGVNISPFKGLGMVLVLANVDAGHAPEAGDAIDAELARLAAEGPAADELAPVTADLARSIEESERDPRYWSGALCRCDGLGIDPDDIASGAGFYKTLTPERVRGAIRRYWRDDTRIALTIRGQEKPPAPKPVEGLGAEGK